MSPDFMMNAILRTTILEVRMAWPWVDIDVKTGSGGQKVQHKDAEHGFLKTLVVLLRGSLNGTHKQ